MKYYAVIFSKQDTRYIETSLRQTRKIKTIFVKTHAHTDTDMHTCKCTQRRVKDVH